MDERSGINDIEDIMVSVFDIVEEYESGQTSRDQALKRALEVIEGLKSVDESMYQEIRNDLFTTILVLNRVARAAGEHEYITSHEIEELSIEQRRKWWLMTMKRHDLDTPHSHVGPFGVLPEFQGRGVGSKLIENYSSRLKGDPSYLETFTATNARFYEKRGHELIMTERVLGMKGYWLLRD